MEPVRTVKTTLLATFASILLLGIPPASAHHFSANGTGTICDPDDIVFHLYFCTVLGGGLLSAPGNLFHEYVGVASGGEYRFTASWTPAAAVYSRLTLDIWGHGPPFSIHGQASGGSPVSVSVPAAGVDNLEVRVLSDYAGPLTIQPPPQSVSWSGVHQ